MGNKTIKDTAGCRAFNRKSIVTGGIHYVQEQNRAHRPGDRQNPREDRGAAENALIPNPMLDAVFLEYPEPVVLPEANAETLYSFSDEAVEHPSCKITAVYTNDTMQIREDQQPVPGRHVVLQLERIENPTPERPGAWYPETTAGMAIE